MIDYFVTNKLDYMVNAWEVLNDHFKQIEKLLEAEGFAVESESLYNTIWFLRAEIERLKKVVENG